MKKRMLCLLLVLVICVSLAPPASADAILFPEDYPPYDITSAHLYNGSCKALNTFLSNFVEAGLSAYDQSSPDSLRIAVVLKHMELNAKSYSGDVKKVEGDDGKTYMRISSNAFEKRMDRLFNSNIPASACPGYEDGSILVSAAHFGGPIQVFASVTDCYEKSDDLYQVHFNAYLVNQDFSNWYGTANDNLPASKLTLLGTGKALVGYDGGETTNTISTADFTLDSFSLAAENIPCAGENLPYGVEPTEPPTEPPAELPTEAMVSETLTATAPVSTEPVQTAPVKDLDTNASSGISTGLLILIVILILAIAVLALVVILLVFKKK